MAKKNQPNPKNKGEVTVLSSSRESSFLRGVDMLRVINRRAKDSHLDVFLYNPAGERSDFCREYCERNGFPFETSSTLKDLISKMEKYTKNKKAVVYPGTDYREFSIVTEGLSQRGYSVEATIVK